MIRETICSAVKVWEVMAVLAKKIFGRFKRVLAPKCNTVLHCIVDSFGNEITDEGSIGEEHRKEFIMI